MPNPSMPITRTRIRIPSFEDLAIPFVSTLIIFLAYTSQYLFYYIEPGPLGRSEAIWFNVFVGCIWWCYDRTCTVDPGPKGWVDRGMSKREKEDDNKGEDGEAKLQKGLRWCKKCSAVKPPRAHHCRKCNRCIPKMDHHCPWTTNCVSHTNFPHFIRFILYAVLSMSLLAYHLSTRLSILWQTRNLPSYLGPPTWTIIHLFILTLLNSFTLFGLLILLTRALYTATLNTTMIESWEIERHEAVLTRAKKNGGFVYANGGYKVFVQRQEFPYDVGVWRNLVQTFGTANVLLWVLPFGGAPTVESAVAWEENGFEEGRKCWPPVDPDKMGKGVRREMPVVDEREYGSVEEEKEAFRRRQEKDLKRWEKSEDVELDESGEEEESGSDEGEEYEEGIDGKPGWTNSDGDRLADYGVDEEAEIVADDDDIPLGELLRRRKARIAVDE